MDYYCAKCKGDCWNANDNFATQKNAKDRFGIIPNNCVNSKNGQSLCPYATTTKS